MWGYPIALVTEHKGDYLIKKGRLEAEHDNEVGQGNDLASEVGIHRVAKQG